MIRNYFKIARRMLWKYKVHSVINIGGLGLAIACCILIALFVKEEWTYDEFHSKAERIYRAYVKEDYGGNEQFFNTLTPFPLGPVFKENFPEIQAQVRIVPNTSILKINGEQFTEQVLIAGQSFFEVFDFEIIAGDGSEMLTSQKSIAISERAAKKYFGDGNPIFQVLQLQLGAQLEEFEVQAVLEDPPGNSSIQFDFLISDLNLSKIYSENALNSAWFNVTPETYLLLNEQVVSEQLVTKFPALIRSLLGDESFQQSNYQVGLQPLTTIHLDNDYPIGLAPVSNPKYPYILIATALLILIVAIINFVTLAIGRSMKRHKEVGVRKIIGASRKQLIGQFIGESITITSLAVIAGLALAILAIPVFNDISGRELNIGLNGFNIGLVIGLLLLIGTIAGSYPAYVLSLFKPIDIAKGGSIGNSRQKARKILVGVQIFISAFLITSTLLIKQQLQYLQNKDLGYQKEQLLVIPLNTAGSGSMMDLIEQGFTQAGMLRAELEPYTGIRAIGAASHDFGNGNWTNIGFTDHQDIYREFSFNIVDENYIPTLQAELIAGRNFLSGSTVDQKKGVIINQAFARSYGWESPIGKKIPGSNFTEHEVIGVVKDFNYASLYTTVEPLVMVMDPSIIFKGMENIDIDNPLLPKLLIRLAPEGIQQSIEIIHQAWDKVVGQGSFEFSFVTESLNQQYRADQNLGRIVNLSTWLAIIIGSLGLYALASLALQNRNKEMGVRRVLGASQSGLMLLLSREFMLLVLVSFLLSIPLTWFMIREWLSGFQYKINLSPDTFLFAGMISILVALFAISSQVIKSSSINPVDALKNE